MNVNQKCTNCAKYPFCIKIINPSENNNCKGWIKKQYDYPPLEGICKVAIEKGLCTGCNRLELKDFKGLEECKIFPRAKYNKVEKGIQLKLED